MKFCAVHSGKKHLLDVLTSSCHNGTIYTDKIRILRRKRQRHMKELLEKLIETQKLLFMRGCVKP